MTGRMTQSGGVSSGEPVYPRAEPAPKPVQTLGGGWLSYLQPQERLIAAYSNL